MREEVLPAALEKELRLRRIAARRIEFVSTAVTSLAIALAVAGVVGLLARRWYGASFELLASITFGAITTAVIASWIVANRRTPSRAIVLARLDRDAGGTGRLLTRAETADARYDVPLTRVLENAAPPELPPWSVPARRLSPWTIFAAIPFLLAPAQFSDSNRSLSAIEPTIERIEEKLATLEEEIALDDSEETDLAERVERVKDEARRAIEDGSLETALEALDRMERELAAAAERAAEAMERAATDAADAALAPDAAPSAEALLGLEEDLAAAGLASAMAAAKEDVALSQRENGSDAGSSASALAAALARRLGEKAQALANAGLLSPMSAELDDRLDRLARELREAREAKELSERDLAELEELDLCDEEQHGPG